MHGRSSVLFQFSNRLQLLLESEKLYSNTWCLYLQSLCSSMYRDQLLFWWRNIRCEMLQWSRSMQSWWTKFSDLWLETMADCSQFIDHSNTCSINKRCWSILINRTFCFHFSASNFLMLNKHFIASASFLLRMKHLIGQRETEEKNRKRWKINKSKSLKSFIYIRKNSRFTMNSFIPLFLLSSGKISVSSISRWSTTSLGSSFILEHSRCANRLLRMPELSNSF